MLGMKQQVVHNMMPMWITGSGMPERVYAFGASLLLVVPVVRHIMSWMGVVPADKQVMLDVLSKASGGALPEGIAGIFTGASRCNSSSHLSSCCPFCPLRPLSALSPNWCSLPSWNLQVAQKLSKIPSTICCWIVSLLHHP